MTSWKSTTVTENTASFQSVASDYSGQYLVAVGGSANSSEGLSIHRIIMVGVLQMSKHQIVVVLGQL